MDDKFITPILFLGSFSETLQENDDPFALKSIHFARIGI